MSATEARRGGADRTEEEGEEPAGYEGSGAWGTWAMILLVALFLISVGATVHSFFATLA